MPNRILREGILTSPRVERLGWPEEVFYRRLHSIVDDFGRYFAHPGLLRAACYPRQLNKVSDSDVGKWLHACAAADLVRVYQVDGEDYVQVMRFGQQVRAKKSRFPQMTSSCVADAAQTPNTSDASAHLDVSVFVDVDTPQAVQKKRVSRKTELPEEFGLSDRVRTWAGEKGYSSLDRHLENFVSYAKRNGKQYADWDEALMTAIRDDWAKVGGCANDDPYGLKKAL